RFEREARAIATDQQINDSSMRRCFPRTLPESWRNLEDSGRAAGALRNPGTDWRRGYGRGVESPRHQARPHGRHQSVRGAALNHPHICTLHDIGPNYLVMEYVEGEPLKGPLPLEKAVEYARQILGALEAARRRGIVHRDLKPANMLVCRSGVKLLDFGLAKVQPGATAAEAEIATVGVTE